MSFMEDHIGELGDNCIQIFIWGGISSDKLSEI